MNDGIDEQTVKEIEKNFLEYEKKNQYNFDDKRKSDISRDLLQIMASTLQERSVLDAN